MRVIGTRHGEKQYETLLSREEMASAEDCGRYYRVAARRPRPQLRRLFTEGSKRSSRPLDDFNSQNTRQLERRRDGGDSCGICHVRRVPGARASFYEF